MPNTTITIAELEAITEAPSSSFIPIDNGTTTNKITVENFNASSNTSAASSATAAAASATLAESYAKGNTGTRTGENTDNAKYYKEKAEETIADAVEQVASATAAANLATSSAGDAAGSAEEAEEYATTASNKASEASTSATSANASALTATGAANSATASAADALSYKDSALLSASSASTSATAAESFAKGGTSSRTGEDTDNAKYYKEQAELSATSAAGSASEAAEYSVKTPYIGANGNWWVWNTTQNAYVDSHVDASITVAIQDITNIAPDASPYVTNTGTSTDPVFHLFLPRANSIVSIAKTSTHGKVDTYTITYTDGMTTTFTVTNGQDGQGSGDMMASDYDPTSAVFTAGGIPTYVSTAVTNGVAGKMAKDGSNADSHVTFEGAFTVGSRASGSTVGLNSTAEGTNNTASNSYAHAEGISTTASGGYAHSEGRLTTASGFGAHAEGVETTASGGCSHAEGYKYFGAITASGDGSHAEGHSEYGDIVASGKGAHAEGSANTASGNFSHVGGTYNTAGYEAQTVVGTLNSNKSTTLFEVGNGTFDGNTLTQSNAFEVYADGSLSTDNGTHKVKLENVLTSHQDISGKMNTDGSNASANVTLAGTLTVGSRASGSTVGTNSTAEGEGNTASGNDSHAEGGASTASGNSSHAEGNLTTASGRQSHAEGYHTTASADYTHAEGYETTASATFCHAEGNQTTANGNGAHAEGFKTVADYSYQHVGGKYNSNKSTTLFEIGNGTSSARSNAFEVYDDGSLSTDNGTTKTKLPVIKTATLAANGTTVSFSGLPSTGNYMMNFFTSKVGLDYTGIYESTTSSGLTVTLTYAAQSSATTVWCVLTEVV